jgi:hypothetical protein
MEKGKVVRAEDNKVLERTALGWMTWRIIVPDLWHERTTG